MIKLGKMMLFKFLMYLISVFILTGCSGSRDQLYQGLPLSVWVERLKSPEDEIRADAIEVLIEIGKPALATEPYLREIARTDPSHVIRVLAIEALDGLDRPIVEFHNFLDDYNAPIIPGIDSELEALYNTYDDEVDFHGKISGADDLAYLKALEEGTLGSERDNPDDEASSDGYRNEEWIEKMQKNNVSNLLNQLNNPKLLELLLEHGESLERDYAGRKLNILEDMESGDFGSGEIGGLNMMSRDSLESILKAAKEALEKLSSE